MGTYKDGISVKTFFEAMIESKQIKYDSIEEKKAIWMSLERKEDPDESIFKLLMKIEKRKGKSHEQIESRILKRIRTKLQAEMTYDEFENTFLVYFCKLVSLHDCYLT